MTGVHGSDLSEARMPDGNFSPHQKSSCSRNVRFCHPTSVSGKSTEYAIEKICETIESQDGPGQSGLCRWGKVINLRRAVSRESVIPCYEKSRLVPCFKTAGSGLPLDSIGAFYSLGVAYFKQIVMPIDVPLSVNVEDLHSTKESTLLPNDSKRLRRSVSV